MNDYRITYTSETGEASDTYITERTESAARKSFNASHKGMGFTIQTVELHRENTLATKQQELDALKAIKKMVAELGPQSYLATAFEGCFEDAEANIENDFGDSWKRRCESTERKLDEAQAEIESLREQLTESQKDWEAAHAANHELAAQKDAEIAALQQRVLQDDDLTDCKQMADNLVERLRREVKRAEATILEYAEHPETTTFHDAVRERKSLANDIAYYTALSERLEKAINNTARAAA